VIFGMSYCTVLRRESEEMHVAKLNLLTPIEFTDWTPDGHLRHSKFCGLREDKTPRDVVRE
jgi:bifunctional non-homologous end joining protein LigD